MLYICIMENIKQDFEKIKATGYFEGIFGYVIKDGYIELTTDMYHDYIVENKLDVKGLNNHYIVESMIYEFDGELEDEDKELWDQDSVSYREWKIVIK